MNINIQLSGLSGNEAAAVDLDRSAGVTPVSNTSIDAGAPKAAITGGTGSPSDIGVLDIGVLARRLGASEALGGSARRAEARRAEAGGQRAAR